MYITVKSSSRAYKVHVATPEYPIPLWSKKRLAQRLPQTRATTEVQKNATRKERQNHGE